MKNKKSIFKIIYIAAALGLCLVPLVCMTFARTDTTTENRRLAAFPAIKTEDGFNVNILSDLGKYFEDHFAFRNRIVAADGTVQSLFGVSAAEGVIKGTDGWLYYTSSAPDYQRLNVFSDRAAFNAAHNLMLTQKYAEEHGAKFVLTVAPNKNSLYPEHMPYYYPAGEGDTSIEKLAPLLEEMGVNYADLFALFREQDETLYLMRDSHWNNKGALLAYNALLDAAEKPHETYEKTPVTRQKDEIGDLGRMAYSVAAKPEWNYHYELPQNYAYATPTKSVEDAYILTENAEADGALLMFRDSFGNTLLPFFAEAYGKACFTKTTPYLLDLYMTQLSPDTVIAEKVERNILDFAKDPPVFPALQKTLSAEPEKTAGEYTLQAATAEYDTRFVSVSGTLITNEDYDAVYIVTGGAAYEAFTVTTGEGDNGWVAYLPQGTETDAAEIYFSAGRKLYRAIPAAGEQRHALTAAATPAMIENAVKHAHAWVGPTAKTARRCTVCGRMETGWQQVKNRTIYYKEDGAVPKGETLLEAEYMGEHATWYLNDGVLDRTYDGALAFEGTDWLISDGRARPAETEEDETLFRAYGEVAKATTPDMTPMEKLKACFVYCKQNYGESRARTPHYNGMDWPVIYANDMFVDGKGNCFSYAAAFAYMAKAVGYEDVYCCNSGGHGWAEVDGRVFDAEWSKRDGLDALTYFNLSYDTRTDVRYKWGIRDMLPWMHVKL